MDLRKLIESLRREKEKLDRVIASLEELQRATASQKKRRGKKQSDPRKDDQSLQE